MPVRAFLDSDLKLWVNTTIASYTVSMPVRAFLDSDLADIGTRLQIEKECFNARQGIS